MPTQPIQIVQLSTTPAHILALDSSGVIWWRRWDKKGWNKMEQVPIGQSIEPTVTPPPAPIVTAPIVAPPAIAQPAISPPVAIPHLDPA